MDEKMLNIYYNPNGEKYEWDLSIYERIFDITKRIEETEAIFKS